MIIPVKTTTGGYDIVAEHGALERVGELIPTDRKVFIVTDSGVPYEYAEKVASQCEKAFIEVIPQGEKSKNINTYIRLITRMANYEFSRGDCVIAVGGGVVGDLSGFVAATYMRGVDFYNIPTTFLSQVDSSIGGKTAIDFDGIKNIVGAFYQPKKVIIDFNVLKTLEQRQLYSGVVESVKMAATSDAELFEIIENCEDISANYENIIVRSLLIKKAVVEEDPTEKGLRKVLNFGHTIGHGIESYYGGEYLHGECVANGMLYMCSEQVRSRIEKIIKRYGIEIKTDFDKNEIAKFICHDKKSVKNGVVAVYVDKIGEFEFRPYTFEEMREVLEKGL